MLCFRFICAVLILASSGPLVAHAETVITVNRYTGMSDFARSRQTFFGETEEGFNRLIGTNVPQLGDSFSCTTSLELQQHLPLGEMISNGTLTAENANRYLPLFNQFAPDQVSFIEVTHTDLPTPETRIPESGVVIESLLDLTPKAHSTLSLIAGQHWDAESGKLISTPLPFQLEPHLANIPLDRRIFKFVFEGGRAFKTLDGDMVIALQRAALIQLQEIHAWGQGFGVDDGWQAIHTLHPDLTAAYEEKYPGTRIKTEHVRDGEAIFMIPLRQLFETIHPERQSPILKGLLNQGLTIDQAASYLQFFKNMEFAEMDVELNEVAQKKPVLVGDFSDLQPEFIDAFLKSERFTGAKGEAIHDLLIQQPTSIYTASYPHAQDYAMTPLYQNRMSDANSLTLTNLDPVAAKADPEYVMKVIAAVITSRIAMMIHFDPAWTLNRIFNFAHEKEIKFTVSTRDEEISKQLSALKIPLIAKSKVSGAEVRTAMDFYERVRTMGAAGLEPSLEIHSYYQIPLDQLMQTVQQYIQTHGVHAEVGFGRSMVEHNLMQIGGY